MYWKFFIEGVTPMDAHGVGLRESIQKLALDPEFLESIRIELKLKEPIELFGQARNLKGTNRVEVICQTHLGEIVDTFRKAIKEIIPEKNILVDSKNIDVTDKTKLEDGTLGNFLNSALLRHMDIKCF